MAAVAPVRPASGGPAASHVLTRAARSSAGRSAGQTALVDSWARTASISSSPGAVSVRPGPPSRSSRSPRRSPPRPARQRPAHRGDPEYGPVGVRAAAATRGGPARPAGGACLRAGPAPGPTPAAAGAGTTGNRSPPDDVGTGALNPGWGSEQRGLAERRRGRPCGRCRRRARRGRPRGEWQGQWRGGRSSAAAVARSEIVGSGRARRRCRGWGGRAGVGVSGGEVDGRGVEARGRDVHRYGRRRRLRDPVGRDVREDVVAVEARVRRVVEAAVRVSASPCRGPAPRRAWPGGRRRRGRCRSSARPGR